MLRADDALVGWERLGWRPAITSRGLNHLSRHFRAGVLVLKKNDSPTFQLPLVQRGQTTFTNRAHDVNRVWSFFLHLTKAINMKQSPKIIIPNQNAFDSHDFVAHSNGTTVRRDSRHPANTTWRQRHAWYQRAKRAGLFSLHEAFPLKAKPTVGIELELYLVDAVTGEPVAAFDEIHQRLPPRIQPNVVKEIFQFQLEIKTGIHETVEEAGDELHQCLTAVTDAADKIGVELLWRANLPDFEFNQDMLFMSKRTRSALERHPEEIPRLGNNGMHMHFGVSRELAIFVADRTAAKNDEFIAVAANSPSTDGKDLKSQRNDSWMRSFPTIPMDYYRDWTGFNRAMRVLNRQGLVLEPKDNYAWVRPTLHGTVEVRTPDTPADLFTALHVAEFIHRSVIDCQTAETWPMPTIDELRRRCRLAARYGQEYLTRFKDGHRISPVDLTYETPCPSSIAS